MAMAANDFVGELRQYIHEQEKAPMYGRSFFDGVMGGTLDRDTLKKWAIQHHYRTGQHVRALGGIFLNTGLTPLDQKMRRHIIHNLIDEETEMGRGDDAHWALSRRLAEALGATPEELAHPIVAQAVIDYVNWVIELGRKEYGLVTMAAMSIGGESRREDSVQRLTKALNEKYGLSRHALEFFFAHMGEAEAHGDPVYEMVREYATTPERQERIRLMLKTWCEKFAAAQEGIFRVAMGVEDGVEATL
jgi:pyrroloquinoline quinone (PQQ) biosynthesis protein C